MFVTIASMSRRLVDQATAILDRSTSRRGFLIKSTMAASALTVSPWRYLLRPVTAYAAICACSGSTCDCGQACCDGYTEFCCVVHGSNSCPPGSFTAGWWKADGTGFCSADRSQPRYYIDCNRCVECGCRCGGSCDNRKTCCTHFRYGQCNQQVGCIGVIDCRVVTCTPPWQLDATCTTAAATDNFTGSHDAPCLHPAPPPQQPPYRLLLLRAMAEGRFFLSNTKQGGLADLAVGYGDRGDIPIVGDWNGDGIDTPGVVRGDKWHLRNSNTGGVADVSFGYGMPGDIPIVGDWNGDGIDTPGVVRGDTWYLRNSNSGGIADIGLKYGNPGDIAIVGDWNGDGRDSPGVAR